MNFKIGDKVKLKDYVFSGTNRGQNRNGGWQDYITHTNQIGIISRDVFYHGSYNAERDFDYEIEWLDGSTSHVTKDNLILAETVIRNIEVFGIVKFMKKTGAIV